MFDSQLKASLSLNRVKDWHDEHGKPWLMFNHMICCFVLIELENKFNLIKSKICLWNGQINVGQPFWASHYYMHSNSRNCNSENNNNNNKTYFDPFHILG